MNLRHFYYRGYYDGLDYQKIIDGRAKTDKTVGEWFAQRNRKLFDYVAPEGAIQLLDPDVNRLAELKGFTQILLQTGGQGLLCGSGYAHETGSLGELKLGFHFDPTSGLPTLPGHSVKGALRAVFPKQSETESVQSAKTRWIAKILRANAVNIPEGGEADFVKKLETAIFEGDPDAPMCKHDVFLEAAMIRSQAFMGRDALAPHDRKTGGIKNPVPIPFAKVLPGVPFRFAFLLHSSTINGEEVDANAKKSLFEAVLTSFGMGAKTRGGYGVFEKVKAAPAAPKSDPGRQMLDKIPSDRFKPLPLKASETYEAMANGKNEKGKTRFVLLVGSDGKGMSFTQKWPTELAEGEIVQVRVVLNMNGQIQELKLIN